MEKKEMDKAIANATHAELLKMLRFFRGTEHRWKFILSLFELPYEAWENHHLQADYLAEELKPEEKKWLIDHYWETKEPEENPLLTLLLLEQAKR